MRGWLLLSVVLAACGAKAPPADAPPAPSAEAPPERPPPGTLFRHEVDAVVDAGLPRFLQFVQVRPALEAGRFVGFEIVSLYPPDAWADIDLIPGDVVQTVNGMPIETELEAYAAFQACREVDRITVRYLRRGVERSLALPIVGLDGAVPPAPPPSDTTSPGAASAAAPPGGAPSAVAPATSAAPSASPR